MRQPSLYQIAMDFIPEDEKLYPSKFEEKKEEYRFVREAQAANYQIRAPVDAAAYFREYVYQPFDKFTQEELWCLMLNSQNVVIYDALIYRGTINTVTIRVGELFRPALYYNSAGIVIGHQHPSNNPTPSPQDVAVTEAIVEAGRLLDVQVLDHCIMGKDSFTSLREQRLGGFK